jgi:hypothetical protein
VLDPEGLQQVAEYDSTYLHLNRTERRDPQVASRAKDLVSPTRGGMLHDAAEKVMSVFTGSDEDASQTGPRER